MTRWERAVVKLSLAILREAMVRSGSERVDTLLVRLVLRRIMPHCRDTSQLTGFWNSAGGDHDLGCGQNCAAARNGICWQLREAGATRSSSAPTLHYRLELFDRHLDGIAAGIGGHGGGHSPFSGKSRQGIATLLPLG